MGTPTSVAAFFAEAQGAGLTPQMMLSGLEYAYALAISDNRAFFTMSGANGASFQISLRDGLDAIKHYREVVRALAPPALTTPEFNFDSGAPTSGY